MSDDPPFINPLHPDRRSLLAMTMGAALLLLVGAGPAAAGLAMPVQDARPGIGGSGDGSAGDGAPSNDPPNASPARAGYARDIPFDEGWKFHRGKGEGLEAPGQDDSGWRRVDLPHDWSVEDIPGGQPPDVLGPFDKDAVGGKSTGFTVGGEGWYRRHFRFDDYPADARIEVHFGGAYMESDVWLNGEHLGRNLHGYIPFAFDLTPALKRGGDNVLAVRVRNIGKNSRWYAGSGLYRQVTLDVLPAGARIARSGVAAWTKSINGGAAEIAITTNIEGIAEGTEKGARLVTRLRSSKGVIAAEMTSPAAAEVKQTLNVPNVRLWSPDSPALYSLESELLSGGQPSDKMAQNFGIRIIDFSPERGMTINGKPTKLHGGCVHHDNGLLGACAFHDADDRRIKLLKARGFNAIRSSHNPSSRSLRVACERRGMLLIEEAFDMWNETKEPQDFGVHFADHWQEVISAMVLAARNSPAVIMWSIGNEIPGRATDAGVEWGWKLANAIKRIDQTRPVTAGVNGILGQEMIAGPQTARPGTAGKRDNASTIFLDIPGYNYRLDEMQQELSAHPQRVFFASEALPKNMFDYAVMLAREPRFLGEFPWTAMDYIGEAGIGADAQIKKDGVPYYFAAWPWINAWCGDLDLLGYQKAQSLARDVVRGLSALEVTVQTPVAEGMTEWVSPWGWPDELPNWSWRGNEGKALSVRVYTAGDQVRLLLNGAPVGEKALSAAVQMHAQFEVEYAPGKLEALAFRGKKLLARRVLETTDPAAELHLLPESKAAGSDRLSLIYVPMEIRDAAGRLLMDDAREITLTLDGPAELIAFGNAGPFEEGSLQAAQAKTYRGRAMAILRSAGKPGQVHLTARAEGLPAAGVTITAG